MAKKHTKLLKLTGKTCRLGKVSNNLEKHGDDYVTAFTIPVTELMLSKAELNAFMRDKDCHASWFAASTGKQAQEPMAWWGGESFYVAESFEADQAQIITAGDKALNFDSSGDPKEDEYRPAIVLSKIVLTPQVGGMTEMRCSLYLHPGIGKTNLALQDAQHHEIKITLVDAKVSEREKRQPQLPLTEADTETAAPLASDDGAGEEAPATY